MLCEKEDCPRKIRVEDGGKWKGFSPKIRPHSYKYLNPAPFILLILSKLQIPFESGMSKNLFSVEYVELMINIKRYNFFKKYFR